MCYTTKPIPHTFQSEVYAATRALHSFPTRRSSDLPHLGGDAVALRVRLGRVARRRGAVSAVGAAHRARRSEEHTSELQSQSNLVCRLLLEKKKALIRRSRCY